MLSRDGFVAFDSQQSEKVTKARIANLTIAIIWCILLDVFCKKYQLLLMIKACVRDLHSRGKRVATWSSLPSARGLPRLYAATRARKQRGVNRAIAPEIFTNLCIC